MYTIRFTKKDGTKVYPIRNFRGNNDLKAESEIQSDDALRVFPTEEDAKKYPAKRKRGIKSRFGGCWSGCTMSSEVDDELTMLDTTAEIIELKI